MNGSGAVFVSMIQGVSDLSSPISRPTSLMPGNRRSNASAVCRPSSRKRSSTSSHPRGVDMADEQPLRGHRRPSAVVVGHRAAAAGEAGDDARRFPAVVRIFLHHDAKVERPPVFGEQADPSLHEVGPLAFHRRKTPEHRREGRKADFLVAIMDLPRGPGFREAFDPHHAFAESAVHRLGVDHSVPLQHVLKGGAAELSRLRHQFPQPGVGEERGGLAPFAAHPTDRHGRPTFLPAL